jgi:hypothetical protein
MCRVTDDNGACITWAVPDPSQPGSCKVWGRGEGARCRSPSRRAALANGVKRSGRGRLLCGAHQGKRRLALAPNRPSQLCSPPAPLHLRRRATKGSPLSRPIRHSRTPEAPEKAHLPPSFHDGADSCAPKNCGGRRPPAHPPGGLPATRALISARGWRPFRCFICPGFDCITSHLSPWLHEATPPPPGQAHPLPCFPRPTNPSATTPVPCRRAEHHSTLPPPSSPPLGAPAPHAALFALLKRLPFASRSRHDASLPAGRFSVPKFASPFHLAGDALK